MHTGMPARLGESNETFINSLVASCAHSGPSRAISDSTVYDQHNMNPKPPVLKPGPGQNELTNTPGAVRASCREKVVTSCFVYPSAANPLRKTKPCGKNSPCHTVKHGVVKTKVTRQAKVMQRQGWRDAVSFRRHNNNIALRRQQPLAQ
jgi:hypothetical protein